MLCFFTCWSFIPDTAMAFPTCWQVQPNWSHLAWSSSMRLTLWGPSGPAHRFIPTPTRPSTSSSLRWMGEGFIWSLVPLANSSVCVCVWGGGVGGEGWCMCLCSGWHVCLYGHVCGGEGWLCLKWWERCWMKCSCVFVSIISQVSLFTEFCTLFSTLKLVILSSD